MKINDLAKELDIDNKELITYLKSKGLDAKSHMQNATDKMIDVAREHFTKPKVNDDENGKDANEQKKENNATNKAAEITVPERKTFLPDDQIPCHSVIPWGLVKVGVDNHTIYTWEYFGDVEYVAYKDLQAWRKKEVMERSHFLQCTELQKADSVSSILQQSSGKFR